MSIYHKSVRSLLKEMVVVWGLQNGQIFTKKQAIDYFAEFYPDVSSVTVVCQIRCLSVNVPSRVHHSPKPGEDDFFYKIDSTRFRLYDPNQDQLSICRETSAAQLDEIEALEDEIEALEEESICGISREFAYESDLRDYLVKNLQVIEPGLTLYEKEGITGVEFPVGGRFIDILAVDSNGDFVVIELKVSRGYDRVIGQLLRYMAWIQKNQAESAQKVRGIIVAREIGEDLMLACSLISNFEYELSFSLKSVSRVGIDT